ETIKPSSLTPSNLKTHVLTSVDYYMPAIPVPFNYNNGEINILMKSLSQCLTQFVSPSMSHIDCNDEVVEFLEASHDRRLEDFNLNDESLHELVPNIGENFPNLLNHFKGDGVTVGVSIWHKAADRFAFATFINQWAKVTRGESPFKPNFITSSISHINNVKQPEVVSKSPHQGKYVQRTFVFLNSKLNELKKKVMSSTDIVNMRNKVIKNKLEKAVGNIVVVVVEKVRDSREIALNEIVSKLRKIKWKLKKLEIFCWFPLYEVNFGWGMPVKVKYLMPKVDDKNLVLMDTPHKDGIEAIVSFLEEEMMIFQQNKELLAYVDV
ncbi:hypothetical protein M8C21_011454, partial [Ambrosia artemisiifolia]